VPRCFSWWGQWGPLGPVSTWMLRFMGRPPKTPLLRGSPKCMGPTGLCAPGDLLPVQVVGLGRVCYVQPISGTVSKGRAGGLVRLVAAPGPRWGAPIIPGHPHRPGIGYTYSSSTCTHGNQATATAPGAACSRSCGLVPGQARPWPQALLWPWPWPWPQALVLCRGPWACRGARGSWAWAWAPQQASRPRTRLDPRKDGRGRPDKTARGGARRAGPIVDRVLYIPPLLHLARVASNSVPVLLRVCSGATRSIGVSGTGVGTGVGILVGGRKG
jgi:hypothetical protein